MTYRIVAYGFRKSLLTWAESMNEAYIKMEKFKKEGYETFDIEEEIK